MKKNLFTAIVIGLLLVSCKTSVGQERVYNSGKTFSIIPIRGWENHSTGNSIIFAQRLTSIRDRFQENVQAHTFPANSMTLDELWNSWVINDFPRSFENYRFKQSGESVINGVRANWIEFTNRGEQGQTFRNLVYILVENDIMYYIICIALDRDYKSVETDFKKMIYSFRISAPM